ncbi:TIGR01621 family pseudouridine synthase [Colwellia asteriadis]|uniref:TIGR01621 family pseudouridine synthase n=1 Tax=Colwellia asteriadis TaxID=517723 RepID=A0ABP3WIQ9_9GAMM
MFKIISEQPDFIVVDKNIGVNFHDEGDLGAGLFSQVKAYLQQQHSHNELYPVHRLDKMTSGLVMFAKNQHSAQRFGELFAKHDIEKYYLAISDKKPTKKQGLIKGDMAKSRRGMFKLMRTMENPAITQFFSYSVANKQRLYLLKPHSGKTHQLRVALSSISAPIIGDPLYNSNSVADRGYLHAYCLKFTYANTPYTFLAKPSTGELFLADSTTQALALLNEPWLLNWPKL